MDYSDYKSMVRSPLAKAALNNSRTLNWNISNSFINMENRLKLFLAY
jgi:hypothetical protein